MVAAVSIGLLPACASEAPNGSYSRSSVFDDPARSDEVAGEAGSAQIPSALADSESRWAEAGTDSYRLQVAEDATYWLAECVWVTVVTDGAVSESALDAASTRPECLEENWTVERLHELIERRADQLDESGGPSSESGALDVTFNDDGVPTAIDFDLADVVDEESSLRVEFTTAR